MRSAGRRSMDVRASLSIAQMSNDLPILVLILFGAGLFMVLIWLLRWALGTDKIIELLKEIRKNTSKP